MSILFKSTSSEEIFSSSCESSDSIEIFISTPLYHSKALGEHSLENSYLIANNIKRREDTLSTLQNIKSELLRMRAESRIMKTRIESIYETVQFDKKFREFTGNWGYL